MQHDFRRIRHFTGAEWSLSPHDLIIFDPRSRIRIADVELDRVSRDEALANGRLIATSPMMYDALLIAEATLEMLAPQDWAVRIIGGTLDHATGIEQESLLPIFPTTS